MSVDERALWHWRARLDPYRSSRSEGVVDGDTYDLVVDQGFWDQTRIRVRAKGIDTAEIFGVSKDSEEYQLGTDQRQYVQEWFLEAERQWDRDQWPVLVRTEQEQGKYGRWIADIQRRFDGAVLREDLVVEWPSIEE